MLNVNDDMDELFKRAAENYPLKTDSADWDKVLAKLPVTPPESAAINSGRKNYRYLLLLLLLLPAAWLGYNYYKPVSKNLSANNSNQMPAAHSTLNKNTAEKRGKGNLLSSDKTFTTATFANDNNNSNITKSNNNNDNGQDHRQINSNKNSAILKGRNSLPINAALPVAEVNSDKQELAITEKKETTLKDADKNIAESAPEKNPVVIVTKADENNKKTDVIDTAKNKSVAKNEKKINKKQKLHSFYAGIIGGPDMSYVKFQSVKNIGVNMGVMLGYSINKRLAVETGISSDKKYYYSDGKYFTNDKIYLAATAKITNVNGNCRMLDVPLNVKYNFKSGRKSNWFSSVGLSSYFMSNENYDYTISNNGVSYQHPASYNESSSFIFSVMNVNAGYSRTLGKKTTLRIEPYVKIPLKKVGVGSLPIMSSGLNIGVTKKIF